VVNEASSKITNAAVSARDVHPPLKQRSENLRVFKDMGPDLYTDEKHFCNILEAKR